MGTAAATAAASPHSINAKSPPEAVAALALDLVPSWSSSASAPPLPLSALAIKVISGGITNALWSVTVSDEITEISPRAIAVRAYGDKTDLLIDRGLEVETLKLLNSAGFGAKVLASFESGRVEEFLPGRALTPEETAEKGTAERIARGLARLHAVDLRKHRGRKNPFSLLFSSCFSSSGSRECDESSLFPTIRDWIALADKLGAEAEEKAGAAKKPSPSVSSTELRAEVALLEEEIKASCSRSSSSSGFCPELSRVVFCHMDLLPGNIMTTGELGAEKEKASGGGGSSDLNEKPEKGSSKTISGPGSNLQFIDFEYGRRCHAGFDVGNHWCEYAGLDCDWSRYPSEEQQRRFARAYLSEADSISISKSSSSTSTSSPSTSSPPSPPSEERVSAFVQLARLFSLAAHLFWTAWGKVQVHVSPIDFDYGAYARSRFDDFRERKKEKKGGVGV